jgi:hypothetical protein
MTQTLVTFSEAALRGLVNDPTLTPGRARACRAGLNRLPGRLEFLVHRAGGDEPAPAGDRPRVVVLPETRPDLLTRRLEDVPFFAPPGSTVAVLALGSGPAAGQLAGVCRTGGALRPLDRVRVAGAGLPVVDLAGPGLAPPGDDPGGQTSLPWPEEEVLSRTIGALGEATWRRLRSLHVTLVGCGRTGSLLATGLRRQGVRRLTLLDPDRLEPHNLGEMDGVGAADVGRPKVLALAEALADPYRGATAPPRPLRGPAAVAGSVLSLEGLASLKPADVVACCADNGAARLATALLAALYLKPLLDVGTGVLPGAGGRGRRVGADVRLVLPGCCLLCLGGVADRDAALQALRGEPIAAEGGFRRERLGSLRSLNAVAVGLGLRLLEEFVAGRRSEGAWLRLETDHTGLPALERRPAAQSPSCRVCALACAGDAGINDLLRAVEVLGQPS